MNNNLITVPTFTFSQGDVMEGNEPNVRVCYYNNIGNEPLIELEQEDRYINFTNLQQLKKLVKAIEKNLQEAKKKLSE